MVKNDSNRVFGLFKKIMPLVLYVICIKQTFLWFINIQQKSGSQVNQKLFSVNEISVFFSHQYFTNR